MSMMNWSLQRRRRAPAPGRRRLRLGAAHAEERAVDLVHGDEGRRHAGGGLEEAAARQALRLAELVAERVHARLDLLLLLGLRRRHEFVARDDLRRHRASPCRPAGPAGARACSSSLNMPMAVLAGARGLTEARQHLGLEALDRAHQLGVRHQVLCVQPKTQSTGCRFCWTSRLRVTVSTVPTRHSPWRSPPPASVPRRSWDRACRGGSRTARTRRCRRTVAEFCPQLPSPPRRCRR